MEKTEIVEKKVRKTHVNFKIVFLIVLTLLFIIGSFNHMSRISEDSINAPEYVSGGNRFFIHSLNSTSEKIKNFILNAEEKKVSLFEERTTSMFVYNGQSPGPVLRGRVGDTFNITFKNNLKVESTIHWHGMQIENSMDGVPGITQESVKPGEIYNYKFDIKNPGIYWYHPHYNTEEQIEMGLQGIIIIDDEFNKVKSNIDLVYVLDDLLLDSEGEIAESGAGHMETMHGRHGNVMMINGQTSFDINGKKGDLVRLRLVNTANGRTFNFAIEGHKFMVIGKDIGLVNKPYELNSLYVAPGERYDVLVYLNKDSGVYEIQDYKTKRKKVLGNLIYSDVNANFEENFIYYNNLKKEILNSNLPNWSDKLNDKENFTLKLSGERTGMMNLIWTINGKTFPNGQENFDLKEGNFYKMKFENLQNQIHPMHIHGQKFLVLKRNGIEVKEKGWKDTVLIYGKEIVEIAFIAEGKGVWVEHCHILEHAKAGMLSTLTIT